MFDQFKAVSEMMKGMSPDQLSQLVKQADAGKKEMEKLVRKIVEEEIEKRNFISRSEAEGIFLKK